MVLSIQDTCSGDESEFYKQLDAPGKKRYRGKKNCWVSVAILTLHPGIAGNVHPTCGQMSNFKTYVRTLFILLVHT